MLESSGLHFLCQSSWALGQTGTHTSFSPFPLQSELISTCCNSIPHSSHFLLYRVPAWVGGNMESWDLAAPSLVNLREGQSRLIFLVGMERAPYFKMCCLHLDKMFRRLKKWMLIEEWDDLLESVYMSHRGMKVLNAGTRTLSFFTETLGINIFLIGIL